MRAPAQHAVGGRRARSTPRAVSVIVPVRDNAAGLRELLGRLSVQTLPADAFEVVVGDDGSHEDLAHALSSDGGGRIRVTETSRRTSYAARNRAAELATGDVLAFCDSDCLPERAWLERGLAALEHSDVVAGEVTLVAPDRPTVWSLLTVDMFLDQRRNVALSRGVTANLFVRRSLFDELGGFDGSVPSGGDYDFVARAVDAGAKLAYARDAVVRHPTIDERRAFLSKVRATNRSRGFRKGRDRQRPTPSGALVLLPFLGVAYARRLALRPSFRLDANRLRASSCRPSWRAELKAMALLYFVVSFHAGFAQVRGWLEGLGAPRG